MRVFSSFAIRLFVILTVLVHFGCAQATGNTQMEGGPPSRPQGHVRVSCGGPDAREVLTDTAGFGLRSITFSVTGRPLEVRRVQGSIGWSGTGPDGARVTTRAGMGYFQRFRLVDPGRSEVLTRPVELTSGTGPQLGTVDIIDSFNVPAGSTRHITVATDTAAREEPRGDFTSNWYELRFDERLFRVGDLVWSDTGEEVQRDEIEYDGTCSARPGTNEFQVRPRFADIYLNRGKRIMSSEVTTGGSAHLIEIVADNDGFEEGSVGGFTVEVNVQSNTNTPVWFQPFQQRCELQDPDGTVLLAGTTSENLVTFAGGDIRVPGRSVRSIILQCELVTPPGLAAAMSSLSWEMRAGALWESVRMNDLGHYARGVGTLFLDQNRLFSLPASGAVVVTLYPQPRMP